MAVVVRESDTEMIRLSVEESFAFFDEKAQRLLGIGATEFLRRWNAGEYDEIADDPDHRNILYLALLGTGGR